MRSWDAIFSENPISSPAIEGTTENAWKAQTKAVEEQANILFNQYCEKVTPLIDFDILMKAIQEGKMPAHFLARFGDQGLGLMQDYLFPSVVMQKRAGVEYDAPEAKFIASPASPQQLAALAGTEPAKQAGVLCNAIKLMGEGGPLQGSAIHSEQVGMLEKMAAAIRDKKPQTISSDTGMGKTFTSKLAGKLISIEVPAIHVAPFASTEEGWVKLTSWNQLKDLKKGKAPHFWVTADSLKELMKGQIPENLKDCLFFMDEYDNTAYLYEKSGGVTTTLQSELYFGSDCGRIVNMSATTNIDELESRIQRYQMKVGKGGDVEKYKQRIAELGQRRDKLIGNIEKEMAREMTIKPAGGDQIGMIFGDFKAVEGPSSYLIELPGKTLTVDDIILTQIYDKAADKFDGRSVAVLWRDHDGTLKAKLKDEVMTLEEFDELYDEDQNIVTVCVYTQDCVGGDFGMHSNDAYVKGQSIVYEGDAVQPTHVVYQNMRRQRAGLGTDRSTFPVTIYVSEAINTKINGNKETFLQEAKSANEQLSQTQELNRLQIKIQRKKEKLLQAVIEEDLVVFQARAPEAFKTRLGDLVKQALETTKVGDRPLEDVRKEIWAEISEEIILPKAQTDKEEQIRLAREKQIKINTSILKLRDAVKLEPSNASAGNVKAALTRIFRENSSKNSLEVWQGFFKAEGETTEDHDKTILEILHRIHISDPPKPPKEPVAQTPKKSVKSPAGEGTAVKSPPKVIEIPPISEDSLKIFLNTGLKDLTVGVTPDLFIKTAIGSDTTITDALAKKFVSRLGRASIIAEESQSKIEEEDRQNQANIKAIKDVLSQTDLPPIDKMKGTVPTMRENLDWYEDAERTKRTKGT